MLKSEFLLQVVIFGMSALVVALLVARLYPGSILSFGHSNNPPPKISSASQMAAKPIIPPDLVSIPSIKLNLPIAAGAISNNQWTLYDDKVSWLGTSKTPGNGNVILYAHNRENLFGNLRQVEMGKEIIVMHEGKSYVYKVVQKRNISPGDVDEVLSSRDQLTLYTCDGSFDQKRLVVIAIPIG